MHTFNTQTLYVKYKPDRSKVKNIWSHNDTLAFPRNLFQGHCMPYGTLLVKVQTKLGQGERKLGNNNNTCDL